jgi:hypothetical protein
MMRYSLNRIAVIRYFGDTRYIFTSKFTSKKHAVKKIFKIKKNMRNFSILKVDDDRSLKQYSSAGLRLDPLSVSPNLTEGRGTWRGPGGRCSISQIYHWDGQTVLSAHRLF